MAYVDDYLRVMPRRLAGIGENAFQRVHAMLGIRDLPPSQRETWRAMFDAFVFEADDPPGAHLPEDKRGVQGRLTPAAVAQVRQILARTLAN